MLGKWGVVVKTTTRCCLHRRLISQSRSRLEELRERKAKTLKITPRLACLAAEDRLDLVNSSHMNLDIKVTMDSINIYEAKTHLSQLLDRAAAGQDIVVCRNGKPLARITRLKEVRRPIKFGVLKDKLRISDDFDAPLPDHVLAEFEGR